MMIVKTYKATRAMKLFYWILWITILHICSGCTFYSINDEYSSVDTESGNLYIPLKEDRPVNDVVLTMNVHPRKSVELRAIDRSSGDDHKYFRIHEVNSTTIQIILSQTLDDLVDNDSPQNVLKFKIQCISAVQGNRRNHDVSYQMVTVYVEDVNDNKPIFLNTPYEITIDETTPLGSSVFMGIKAFDRDKPNTPNSDVQYFIGQQTTDAKGGFFMLDSAHRPHLILKRSLDFDHGIRQFDLNIIARDRGIPPQQTNTSLSIFIDDVDDLPPMFSQEAYYTKVKEFFTISGKSIHKPLKIDPPIEAFDQDSLNSTLIYGIVSGNEREVFWMHPTQGVLYLKKEIDLEAESLPDNTFVLQIDVRQKNDILKRALARVEIEIIDINDNQPEFEVDLYNISIVENLPNGFSVLQVNALDRDQSENALFYYKIFKEEPRGAFSVDPQSGWMTVKNQSLLDREERPTVKLIIQAIEKVKPYNRREVTSDSTVAVDITLLDSNDNSPIFEGGNLYEFKVNINSSVGFVVGKIKAYDPDDGPNGKITYEMKNRKETSVPFVLDPKTGVLKVTGKLITGRIALFVEACDQPINPSETRCTLAVLTLDIVDFVDATEIKFMGAPYEFWIGSNAPIGTSIGQVRVVYRDDIIFDLLHSYSEGVPFAIEEQSGIITVIRPINSFNRNAYNFEAVATFAHMPVEHVKNQSRSFKKSLPEELGFQVDEGIVSDLNFSNMYIANVTINVVSPSNKNAVFVKNSQNQFIEFRVMENQANAVIGNLLAKNFTDMNKNLQAAASSSQASTTTVRRPIARENRQIANMNSSKFRKSSSEVRKNITAVVTTPSTIGMIARKSRTNIFNSTARRKAISYGRVVKQLPPITTLKSGNKTEEKSSLVYKYGNNLRGKNRIVRATKNLNFFIVNDYDLKNKMFISNDGKLMTINGLDREEKDSYKLSVIAEYTNGLVESAGIYQINVLVGDENDNAPHFERQNYIGIVSENCALGTEVLLNNLIIVNDADAGKNADFQLSILGDGNRLFTIEKSNYVAAEHASPFNNFNNSALALFSDTVLDEYSSMIDINLHLMMLSTRDTTTNQSHYVIKFSGPSQLDRERKSFYKLRLLAKDTGGLQEEAQLMIFVTDKNDNAPSFEKLAVFKQTGIEILQYSDKMEIYFIENAHVGFEKPEYESSSKSIIAERLVETTTTIAKPNQKMRIRQKHPIGSPRSLKNDDDDDEIMVIEDRAFKSNSPEIISKSSKYPLFSIEESIEPGTTILQFTASDDDYGPNAQVFYEISSQQVNSLTSFKGNVNQLKTHQFFIIDRNSGELKVNRQLVPNIEILVNVTAKDLAGLKDSVQIGIQISDVNNHEPVFLRPFYSFDIEEGFHVSKILGSVQAVDDDFDDNANITYSIVNVDASKFPFSIIPKTGLLKVSGQLDREQRSLYEFKVMARDNSRKYKQLNATVTIEINIIDINDNVPVFINYDDVMINEIPIRGRKLNSDLHHNENIAPQNFTPVYKISLDRNVSPRRLIKEIKATDADYALNGMVFYNFLHNNVSHLFEIDAREGFIMTTTHQDQLRELNKYDVLNLTVVASDLGNPVKSSYAIILIVLTGEKRFEPTTQAPIQKSASLKKNVIATKPILFVNQYYEIDVLENSPTPMRLIQFNITNDESIYLWSLTLENKNYSIDDITEVFSIDRGILWLQKPLDREEYNSYSLKIRAELSAPKRPRTGKSMQVMYPVTDDRIENLDENEVRVAIRVVDVNDNSPVFREQSPIIAVIPDTVTYGYNVLKVTADDKDIGLNGDVRYAVINEPSNFFGIDSLTGQVKTLGPLWRSHQKVFGFDVKAIDRQGSENGKSSIVNVLVYVLEEHKHVKFIMSGTTMEIEKQAEVISRSLSEATNLIVKIRMLEPHETSREFWTNVYIYAIDPKTNTVVEMEDLQEIMEQINMSEVQPSIPIVELTKLGVPAHLAPKVKQGSGELASIVLSITILIGGISTAICILCVRYKRRIQNAISPIRGISQRAPSRAASQIIRQHLFLPQPMAGNSNSNESSTDPVSDDTCITDVYQPVLKQLIPTRKNNHISGNQHHTQNDKREYIDIPLPKSIIQVNLQNHEAKCTRYNDYILPTKNNIIKHYQLSNNGCCSCSSDDKQDGASSNNSYEDSLKEEEFATTETETTMTSTTRILAHQRTRIYDNNNFDRQSNRHSFAGFQTQGRNNKRNKSFMYPNNIR